MNEVKKQQGSNGIGILSVLTIVFIVLKLTSNIDWSWFWVLAPTIIPFGIAILILVVIGIILMVQLYKQHKK